MALQYSSADVVGAVIPAADEPFNRSSESGVFQEIVSEVDAGPRAFAGRGWKYWAAVALICMGGTAPFVLVAIAAAARGTWG
jgi:hypothetical protein